MMGHLAMLIVGLGLVGADPHRDLANHQESAQDAAFDLYQQIYNLRITDKPALERKITAIERSLAEARDTFEELRESLPAPQRDKAKAPFDRLSTSHADAERHIAGLRHAVRAANGVEASFHAAELYTALGGAVEAHQDAMEDLGVR